jgi:hypothetical protein
VTLLERVASARAAGRETYGRVGHLLTPRLVAEPDGLLLVDPVLKITRCWMRSSRSWSASRSRMRTLARWCAVAWGWTGRDHGHLAMPDDSYHYLGHGTGRLRLI